jgi:hypothetical protein
MRSFNYSIDFRAPHGNRFSLGAGREKPADPVAGRPRTAIRGLGGAQRGDERRSGLFCDEVGEAAAAARNEQRDLDLGQPVVAVGRMRPRARPRPISTLRASRALTGFIAT